jgi:hypothetical protein
MSLVVNPTNPLNLVGFTHYIDRTEGPTAMEVLYSADGGRSWIKTLIDPDHVSDGLGSAGRFDPTLTFDDNGREGETSSPVRNDAFRSCTRCAGCAVDSFVSTRKSGRRIRRGTEAADAGSSA